MGRVVQREARCFIVNEPQVGPYRDPALHFDTRADAEKAIGDLGIEGAHVGQWPEPCWLAQCDDCGAILGSDDFDEAHYDTHNEAARHAEAIDDHCDATPQPIAPTQPIEEKPCPQGSPSPSN